MTTTQNTAGQGDDARWYSHYDNAAERLFGKRSGDTLTQEEDEACVADANARLAVEAN